jgi:DNA repair protein RadC
MLMSRSALQPSLFDQPPVTKRAKAPPAKTLREQSNVLRTAEILRTVLGLADEQVQEVLEAAGGAHPLARLPEPALLSLPHIGPKRAKLIRAMTEWALLLVAGESEEQPCIRSVADAANLMMLDMSLLEQEEIRVLGLDTKNFVTCRDTVYSGSLNSALVRISEVLRPPILYNCASMIVLHNHPSGDPTPSEDDVRVTELLVESGKLVDIEVLDHIIIGRNRFVSLRERGLGFGEKGEIT